MSNLKSATKELKIFPGQTLAMDPETGIVEAYVSVMGILDLDDPPDLIEMGAFSKSVSERGPAGANRIRVLWQHSWNEVIGKPLALVEHSRDMLPAEILVKYPQATGGLYAKTQFILDVQRGREAYALYAAGAMDEWSIGFDALNSMWEKENGNTFRRLKELRLWEYSPVTWGANPGTVTTSVKDAGAGSDDPEARDLPAEELAGPSVVAPTEVLKLRLRLAEIHSRLSHGGNER